MESYTSFAAVYDMFMDNIPYEEWASYVISLLREEGIDDGLVLDLGCGTGSLTEILAREGYDMTGIDLSPDMLQIAMEKRMESGRDILYLNKDMREFELYGTVRAIISICDSMNYLLEKKDLVQTLRLANNYLDPGGIFIFDLNTEHKYRDILGQCTIAEDREESSFIWDNNFDEETGINEYNLSLFIQEEEDLYRKYQETHYQKAYSLDEVKAAVKEAGMELAAIYDAFTRNAPSENSERIYVIARERGKNIKNDSRKEQ